MQYMLSLGGEVRRHFKAPHCHSAQCDLLKKFIFFCFGLFGTDLLKKHFCGEFLSLICHLLWSSSQLAIQNLVDA